MRPDHNRVAGLVFALTILIAGYNAAAAAELAIPPRHAPKVQGDFSMQAGPPNCSRWTDECVSCSRGAAGEAPVCSNIGIACQPKAIRCTGADPAKK